MTLFSVDVETSGLSPRQNSVTALSVIEMESEAHVTCRIEGPHLWDDNTAKWWRDNCPATWWDLEVKHPHRAAVLVTDFVESFPAPYTFVAWPASFDYPFLNAMFDRVRVRWPFSHRTLDIKSYLAGKFNVDPEAGRLDLPNGLVEAPLYPHDPYYDALAQARTYKTARDWNTA